MLEAFKKLFSNNSTEREMPETTTTTITRASRASRISGGTTRRFAGSPAGFPPLMPSDYRVDWRPDSEVACPSRNLRALPATARDFYGDDKRDVYAIYGWNAILKEILKGTREQKEEDDSERHEAPSPLVLLRNHESTILRNIFEYISIEEFAPHVKLTIPAQLVGNTSHFGLLRFVTGRSHPNFYWRDRGNADLPADATSSGFQSGFVAFAKCGQVAFPEPNDRNVNMMPFIFGKKKSLPPELQCYYPLIEACPYTKEEIDRVGYLTIHESHVEAGKTQRRPGLHIESPGFFRDDPNAASFKPAVEHPWGMGMFYGLDHYEGGIYFASSVDNSTQVWDALVDKNVPGIVDRHGGCEHLRKIIGPGTKLGAGDLIWMTDCTPHEALPQEESGYRQFFRVVSPYISHWYADHSTPNPRVPVPRNVKVIHGRKFQQRKNKVSNKH